MKTHSTLAKTFLFLATMMVSVLSAGAAVFTAVTSGNFDDEATWGGPVPGPALLSDVVIIPYGLTVSLTGDQTTAGTASVVVNGTLNSTADHAGLIMNGGNLSGGGVVNVDVLVLGSLSSLAFTGDITANELTSYGITIASPSAITVREKLRLAAGDLHFATGQIEMAEGATLEMAGGTFSAVGSGSILLDSSYNLVYLAPASPAGIELSGPGLKDITVNTPGRVRVAHDLAVDGLLTLTQGVLDLSGHNLTFNAPANLSATGTGRIAASATSNIVIASSADISGSLKFATGENTIGSLMLFMGHTHNTVALGADVYVTNTLTLSNGKLLLGSYDVHLNEPGTVSGGSQASYVVTNGGGKLYLHVGSAASVTFPIGTINNYSPITVTADAGSPSDVLAASTSKEVFVDGMSGMEISQDEPMVNATAYLTGTTSLPINYTIKLSWMADMQTETFSPQQAFISHYTQGSWDQDAPSPAMLDGGMYSISRSGIRSLSPFRVAGYKPAAVSGSPSSFKNLAVYPNPTTDELNFRYDGIVSQVEVHDVSGTRVKSVEGTSSRMFVGDLPPGNYILSIAGDTGITTHKFTRQ